MSKVEFSHPHYALVGGDKIVRNQNAPRPTPGEDAEILQELARYVEAKMVNEHGFVSIQIPEDEDPSTSILASPEWMFSAKLLVVVQNAYGSQLGIFSRSICFDKGISKGTWLPYVERALVAGYGVIIVRPNTNSVIVEVPGEKPQKVPIKGSESPEIHVLNVWENVISRAEHVNHIAFLSFGNGASLCKDLYLREMVSCGPPENNRIKAFVTIEASHIIEKDDAGDIRENLGRIAVNMESNPAPIGNRLAYRKDQLGCVCMSLGLPPGETDVANNVATSVSTAMESVFKYLTISEAGGNVSANFSKTMARDFGLDPATAVISTNPNAIKDDVPPPPAEKTPPPPTPEKGGFFSRLFGSKSAPQPAKPIKPEEEKLTVADFDLLKIVGKGAFGKVS